MRALVKTEKGVGKMELQERPEPEVRENEVLVRVKCVGVCGTDLKIQEDTFPYEAPVIVGHEFSGEIERVGKGVRKYGAGMRVVAEQHFGACGVCRYCQTGERRLCGAKRSPGYYRDGAYAEYIAVEESLLHEIPAGVTYEAAALTEPFAIAAQAVRGMVAPEQTAVILGSGPIALLMVQLLRANGAGKVYVTGLSSDEPQRFPIVRELGAEPVNVEREDPVERVRKATAGEGADLVVDVSGARPAILQGIELVRRGGKVCALGMPAGEIGVPWKELVMKAVEVRFSFSSGYEAWESCLSMLARGAVRTEAFTENVYPLDEWEQAFADARCGRVLKAILRVG